MSIRFQNILCALVSGMDQAETTRQAELRAEHDGSRLTFLPVVRSLEGIPFPEAREQVVLQELHRNSLGSHDLPKSLRGIMSFEHYSRFFHQGSGHSVETIAAEANRTRCDLLVLPYRPRKWLYGKTVDYDPEGIVRKVTCPVLVVHPGSHRKKVLAATDFADSSLPEIHTAVEESQRMGCELLLMHSLDVTRPHTPDMLTGALFPGGLLSAKELGRLRQNAEQRLQGALHRFGAAGAVRVAFTPPGVAIVESARREDAELVVIGTVGRTGLSRLLLGSVAEYVLRYSPCSVLVVRLNGSQSREN